jgi:hypothetical protein
MRMTVIEPSWQVDAFPLRGLLFCVCGQPFCPWGWGEGRRAYLSLCGCRLRPVDAEAVERRAQAEAQRTGTSSAVVPLGPEMFQRLFARIEIGGTVDEVRIVRRP